MSTDELTIGSQRGRCPKCRSPFQIKTSNRGPFWACTGYPNCRNTMPLSREDKARFGVKKRASSRHYGNGFRKPRRLTTQQQAAVDAALRGDSFIVRARAGTGKTSAIQSMLWAILDREPKTKMVTTAFNKKNAADLAIGAPAQALSQTWHSLGKEMMDIILRAQGLKPTRLGEGKQSKPWRVSERYFPIRGQSRESAEGNEILGSTLRELMRLTKARLVDPTDRKALEELRGRYEKLAVAPEIWEQVVTVLTDAMEWSFNLILTEGAIDFEDMIYGAYQLAIQYDWKPMYDIVFVDEAQDLNRCQQMLACLVANQIIIIGDDRQSIYAFTGADTQSLDNFPLVIAEFFDGVDIKTYPLTTSWRCPTVVGNAARMFVSDFETAPNAAQGEILSATTGDLRDWLATTSEPDILVTSRLTAPLVRLAWQLLILGRKTMLVGMDLFKEITEMVVNSHATKIKDFRLYVLDWLSKQLARINKAKTPSAQLMAAEVQDKADSMILLCVALGDNQPIDVYHDKLVELFGLDPKTKEPLTTEGVIRLSTIHRAKGAEAKYVVAIGPHAPHGRAKTDEDMQQELNLLYVQITRTLGVFIYELFRNKEGVSVVPHQWVVHTTGVLTPDPQLVALMHEQQNA